MLYEEQFLGQTALSMGQNAALMPLALLHPSLPLAAMSVTAPRE